MSRVRALVALLACAAALAGCQEDSPQQEFPCEYWRTADTSRVTVPEDCLDDLQNQAPADETPTTAGDIDAGGY